MSWIMFGMRLGMTQLTQFHWVVITEKLQVLPTNNEFLRYDILLQSAGGETYIQE